ncbi:MAG: hypothetical protein HY320_02900 [Armatimonadetes bacterium]|nr:hypothetical protein [Armatimonadota bacterium]
MRYGRIGLGALVAVLSGLLIPMALGVAGQQARTRIDSAARTVQGEPVGDVLVNGQVVIRLRSAVGSLSPGERARIVADRLRRLDTEGRLRPETVDVGTVDGTALLLVDGVSVTMVDSRAARAQNTTPLRLATDWRTNLRAALAGERVGGERQTQSQVGQKLVPIISVGSGLRVGAALVAGERDRLDNTRAVAMLETDYRDAVRARLLVPISTSSGLRDLDRVPGVAVIGVADIEL